jgi:hypothetical protein
MVTNYDQKPRIQFMTLRQRESKAGRTYYVGYQGDLVFVGFEGHKEINGKLEKIIEVFAECSPREQRSSARAVREQDVERADARSDARPSSVESGESTRNGSGNTRRRGESSRKSEAAREIIDRYGGADAKLDDDIPF